MFITEEGIHTELFGYMTCTIATAWFQELFIKKEVYQEELKGFTNKEGPLTDNKSHLVRISNKEGHTNKAEDADKIRGKFVNQEIQMVNQEDIPEVEEEEEKQVANHIVQDNKRDCLKGQSFLFCFRVYCRICFFNEIIGTLDAMILDVYQL
jgi:hypothetical protein